MLADRLGVFGDSARTDTSDIQAYDGKVFKVTYVVDGDTLDIDAPDAVRGKSVTRIRLWGVDTPETVKPNTPTQHFGPQASAFTKKFCLGSRKFVRLALVKNRDTRCKYGRLLAYVIAEKQDGSGACLNAELIAQGYGYHDPRFSHPRRDEFAKLQQKAFDTRVGLWAEAKSSDMPYYLSRKFKSGR
jgi:micrococcal nuclease